MRRYPYVPLRDEMIAEARRLIPFTRVNRTIASRIDTLTGHLGEFAFAQYYYGDWRRHRVGRNRGETDFGSIEIKTSAFPFSERLHLLVREDYARKRKPDYYLQVIIDVNGRAAEQIRPGTRAYLCGYATGPEVDGAPKKDFGSKLGHRGGYCCHYIPLSNLHPMEEFIALCKQGKIRL